MSLIGAFSRIKSERLRNYGHLDCKICGEEFVKKYRNQEVCSKRDCQKERNRLGCNKWRRDIENTR